MDDQDNELGEVSQDLNTNPELNPNGLNRQHSSSVASQLHRASRNNGQQNSNRMLRRSNDTTNNPNKTGQSNTNKNQNMPNHSGKNNPKNDMASNKLKNNKNKNRSFLSNLINKRKSESSSGEKKEDNAPQNNAEADSGTEEIAAAIKRKLIIKIALAVLGILLPLLVIIVIVVSVFGVIGSFGNFLKNILFGKPDYKFEQYETTYYQEMNSIEKEFKDKCNMELDTNYLHTSLMYIYYLDEKDPGNSEYNEMLSLLKDMRENVVSKLMDDEGSIKCNVDYEIGGNLYTTLLNYDKLRDRYNRVINTKNTTYQDVLQEIFDLSEMINVDETESYAIPDELEVKRDSNSSVPIKQYISGIIYANVDSKDLTNPEKIKAYAVVYTTNILSRNNVSINTQSISNDSLKDIDYCDPDSNCNGKGIISDTIKNAINNAVDSVYGNVLINKDGKYDNLNVVSLENIEGTDFKEILLNVYSDYSIRDAKEDKYDNGVNYGNEKVLTEVIFYNQTDYKDKFCGLKNETISRSGCGTTAMAIVASTYENNKKYDPVYMSEEARKTGGCGANNGTYEGFFKTEAKRMGYKYLSVKKTSNADELNKITKHLREGHLVVAHMAAGHFTSNGHYIVLGGIDPETKNVYVYDPYTSVNSSYRKTGNGWYSFNDIILKEAKPANKYTAFHIMWKE